MKKSLVIISFAFIFLLSMSVISAGDINQNERVSFSKGLKELWGKITGKATTEKPFGRAVGEAVPIFTCTDSDGNDITVQGSVTTPNNPISIDSCVNSSVITEYTCSSPSALQVTAINSPCQSGSSCQNGACKTTRIFGGGTPVTIPILDYSNLNISIATLKDSYKVGEQIKLTDPPETGNVVETMQEENSQFFSNGYSDFENTQIIQDGQIIPRVAYQTEFAPENVFPDFETFTGTDLMTESAIFNQKKIPEFNGYIIEFEEKPVLAKKIELKNSARSGVKLKKYSKSLEKENEKFENKIISELGKQGIKVEIEKKFINVFNGVVIKGISEQEAKEIEKIKGAKKVWPNSKVYATLMNSVPLINADDVWQMPNPNVAGQYLTGEGIKIAVIDTGIDYTHPDLGGCLGFGCKVIGGYDFVNEDNDPMDDGGHGTHVAATAAGDGVLKGVAPDAKLYGFKVLDAGGGGWEGGIISGIEFSIDLDGDGNIMEDGSDYVDIISMSLGGGGNPDDPMSQAVDNVVDAGVVAVIAAGNGNCGNCIGSPGKSRKAITVGASDKSDIIAGFSSRGPVGWRNSQGKTKSLVKPDVTAPGGKGILNNTLNNEENICAAQSSQDTIWQMFIDSGFNDIHCLDNEHIAIFGTSMATPHVAGAAALIKQAHPDWTPDEIKMALRNTAVDIGENILTQGQGRINVLDAVNSQKPPLAILNEIDFLPSGQIDIYGTAKGDNFNNYEVYYSLKDSGNWNLICQGNIEVDNMILWNDIDADILSNGEY